LREEVLNMTAASRDNRQPDPEQPNSVVCFKLGPDLIPLLDQEVEKLRASNPGMRFSRADVLRNAFIRSLER
jgi:hypothetical protein